ncbi:hypothetical protein Verru16b_01661 [Lacunisphaera limnophila]|uniref:Uncharacterized protein n=1 Tax=Lacunisphaera limnophila TaxID=1838286 RepID=A0A1D8AUN8_9BACT|nr:hypothetical protein [Lacunisphaera limnophila]AOS44598.1 hypothetical protein Verru16b_01661 [Lacunisphaera limnophila]
MPGPAPSSRLRLVPILLAQGIGFACGVASIGVNSHLLPPATLGLYGLFLSVVPIGTWVVHAGLAKFVGRHWAASPRRPQLAREVTAAWARRLPWLAVLTAAASWFMPGGSVGETLVMAGALFAAASLLSLGQMAQAALQAMQAHWRDCAVTVAGSLTRSFGPPLLYAALGGSLALLWTGFTLHALVLAAAGVWMLRPEWQRPGPVPAGPPGLTAVYEGPLFIILAAAGWTTGAVNRWLIASFYGETEAGYFTLMGGAAGVVTSMLGTVIMQYAQPGLYARGDRAAGEGAPLARQADRLALGYALAAATALAGLHGAAPWLVGSLINPAYAPALFWIVPGGAFTIAIFTAVIYHATLLAGLRESACARVDLTTSFVLVGGCVLGAVLGRGVLAGWMTFAPVVTWLLTRTLARQALFRPAPAPAPAPDRSGTSGG